MGALCVAKATTPPLWSTHSSRRRTMLRRRDTDGSTERDARGAPQRSRLENRDGLSEETVTAAVAGCRARVEKLLDSLNSPPPAHTLQPQTIQLAERMWVAWNRDGLDFEQLLYRCYLLVGRSWDSPPAHGATLSSKKKRERFQVICFSRAVPASGRKDLPRARTQLPPTTFCAR